MRLSVRLLCGIGIVTLLGLRWTFVDTRDVTPVFEREIAIERPLEHAESTPPRPATRAGAPRSGGGLPARGARSATGSPSRPVASTIAQPTTAALVTATGSTVSRPTARDSVRRQLPAVPVSLDTTNQQAGGNDAAAPPEKERPRERGIAGAVLEKNGTPAVGVPIGLKARRVFNGAAPASPLRATTDGSGGFAFGTVADGEYEIATEKTDRYERATALVRAGADAVVLVVEPAADGVVSIRGVVERASGGALEGVRVQAIGQANAVATTDGKGAYVLRIPAGAKAEQAALQFRRAGYRDRRWTMAEGLRTNDHEVIANVRLDPDAAGISVTGVVTSTTGVPVARAQVQLNSAAQGRSYRAVSGSDGRFTLANVEAGAGYRLWVRPQSGFKDGLLENVLVDAAAQLDVQLTPIGVATLRGRMVTPEGAAVPGFTMFIVASSAGGPRSSSVTSDGEGRFIVADLPEGGVVLQTRAAPAISASGIELSAARPDADVTVVVDVGAHRFEGRLITSDGEAAAGATVSLESTASIGGVTSRSSRQTTTDADGNFAFTQLGGGMHVVSAALAGAGSVRLEHAIAAGMEPVHIRLPGKRGRQ